MQIPFLNLLSSRHDRITIPTTYDHLSDEESLEKKPSSQITTSPRPHHILTTTLLVIIILLLTILLLRPHHSISSVSSPVPIPDFPRKPHLFTYQPTWEYGPASSELWSSVLPAGGLILVNHPEKYNLPKGLNTTASDAQVFGVSVTHQYHCLKMIRTHLQSYITTESAASLPHVSSPEDPLPRSLQHVFHCLDYLRQTVLCNADMTIEHEALSITERKPTGHIDGYGVTHQCRDWDQVREWMTTQLPPDPVFLKPQ